jgi:hypothetical protein
LRQPSPINQVNIIYISSKEKTMEGKARKLGKREKERNRGRGKQGAHGWDVWTTWTGGEEDTV